MSLEKTCPECKAAAALETHRCAGCGHIFATYYAEPTRLPTDAPAPHKACPKCKAISPLANVRCPDCGHRFRTNFMRELLAPTRDDNRAM